MPCAVRGHPRQLHTRSKRRATVRRLSAQLRHTLGHTRLPAMTRTLPLPGHAISTTRIHRSTGREAVFRALPNALASRPQEDTRGTRHKWDNTSWFCHHGTSHHRRLHNPKAASVPFPIHQSRIYRTLHQTTARAPQDRNIARRVHHHRPQESCRTCIPPSQRLLTPLRAILAHYLLMPRCALAPRPRSRSEAAAPAAPQWNTPHPSTPPPTRRRAPAPPIPPRRALRRPLPLHLPLQPAAAPKSLRWEQSIRAGQCGVVRVAAQLRLRLPRQDAQRRSTVHSCTGSWPKSVLSRKRQTARVQLSPKQDRTNGEKCRRRARWRLPDGEEGPAWCPWRRHAWWRHSGGRHARRRHARWRHAVGREGRPRAAQRRRRTRWHACAERTGTWRGGMTGRGGAPWAPGAMHTNIDACSFVSGEAPLGRSSTTLTSMTQQSPGGGIPGRGG